MPSLDDGIVAVGYVLALVGAFLISWPLVLVFVGMTLVVVGYERSRT